METERRILRSTSVLLSASLVSQLASFGFVVHYARTFSPEVFGEYSFALSLGALLSILVSVGTNRLLLRKCSEDPREWRTHAGVLFPAQTILAIFIWISIVGGLRLTGAGGTELRIVAIVTSFQLLTPIWNLFAVGFTATERMAYAALSDAGGRVMILLVGGVAIWIGAAAEWVLLVLPVSALLTVAVLWRVAASEFGAPQLRFDLRALVALAGDAMPFFGIAALTIVYDRIGLLFLRAASGAEDVGVFASAERLVMAAGIVHVTFASAIFPAMVRLLAADKDRFLQLANRCVRLMILITLPTATVLHLFAPDLIALLFGDRYQAAAGVLQIVAWLIAIRGVTAVLTNVGIASDHRRHIVTSKAVGIVTLIIVCVLLVPTKGAHGLAFAMLCAQSVMLVLVFVLLRPTGYLPSVVRPCIPVLAACAVTLALVTAVSDKQLLLRVILVVVAGPGLLWLLRAVRPADLKFIRQILRNQSNRQEF